MVPTARWCRWRLSLARSIVTRSETEALLLEANLIKQHKPLYNIRLADDKSYPYLRITDERFPRLLVVRDLPNDAQVRVPGGRGRLRRGFHDPKRKEVFGMGGGHVFGPYPQAQVMWRLRDIAGQVFGLRHCRRDLDPARPQRPCLNFHIKRCVGPCRGDVSPEEYRRVVDQVEMLLEGRTDEVRKQFQERMAEAAELLDFERAASYRDKIKVLAAASEEQLMNAAEERDQDVIDLSLVVPASRAADPRPDLVIIAEVACREARDVRRPLAQLDNVEVAQCRAMLFHMGQQGLHCRGCAGRVTAPEHQDVGAGAERVANGTDDVAAGAGPGVVGEVVAVKVETAGEAAVGEVA